MLTLLGDWNTSGALCELFKDEEWRDGTWKLRFVQYGKAPMPTRYGSCHRMRDSTINACGVFTNQHINLKELTI